MYTAAEGGGVEHADKIIYTKMLISRLLRATCNLGWL